MTRIKFIGKKIAALLPSSEQIDFVTIFPDLEHPEGGLLDSYGNLQYEIEVIEVEKHDDNVGDYVDKQCKVKLVLTIPSDEQVEKRRDQVIAAEIRAAYPLDEQIRILRESITLNTITEDLTNFNNTVETIKNEQQ